ncbi:MAG: asparagine--tRNA ligase [Candidatus Thermoplasmatota archaeon]
MLPIPIKKIFTNALEKKNVKVRGWIYRKRSSGKIIFIILRDNSGIIQCTVEKDLCEGFELADKALIESSVCVYGVVNKDDRAPGGFELRAEKFELIGSADVFPITEDKSEEHLLNNRHLWIRARDITNLMKIKATVLKASRDWFNENGFYEVTPPIITSNACEGGSTLFKFDYFGMNAYLSQSAQLYLEALIYSLEKVWSLTPSFRAEKSRTTRHLAEYWHLEEEAAWTDNEENMRIQEELVSYICQAVAKERKEELNSFGRKKEELEKISPPFKRLTYSQAIDILKKKGYEILWGSDFGAKEERELTIDEDKPVFIMNYPKEIKAFYMKENPEDKKTYLCSDLLAPEGFGEIIGGSERETSVDKLIERLKEQNANMNEYEWYIDLRKYGSIPHSGFGLGIERLVRWLGKVEHIRDTIPFPRTINRAYP